MQVNILRVAGISVAVFGIIMLSLPPVLVAFQPSDEDSNSYREFVVVAERLIHLGFSGKTGYECSYGSISGNLLTAEDQSLPMKFDELVQYCALLNGRLDVRIRGNDNVEGTFECEYLGFKLTERVYISPDSSGQQGCEFHLLKVGATE